MMANALVIHAAPSLAELLDLARAKFIDGASTLDLLRAARCPSQREAACLVALVDVTPERAEAALEAYHDRARIPLLREKLRCLRQELSQLLPPRQAS